MAAGDRYIYEEGANGEPVRAQLSYIAVERTTAQAINMAATTEYQLTPTATRFSVGSFSLSAGAIANVSGSVLLNLNLTYSGNTRDCEVRIYINSILNITLNIAAVAAAGAMTPALTFNTGSSPVPVEIKIYNTSGSTNPGFSLDTFFLDVSSL